MERLFELAKKLQAARTFDDLLDTLAPELTKHTGYEHFWIFVRDSDDDPNVRLVTEGGVAGKSRTALFPIENDRMIQEVFDSKGIIVVEEASEDPRTNKAAVAMMGNRTIVSVPIAILDKPFAGLGMGTFGEEGVRVPSRDALDYLTSVAGFVSAAASRIRLDERSRKLEQERHATERNLARMQRLESMGVLAGGVAHDFNNLITVVLASASLAKDVDDSERGPILDDIIAAARRAQALTRQLLAMGRAQALTLQDLDPVALVTDIVALLRRVIPTNVVIDLIAPDLGVLVEGDKTQLDQVFMNLFLNARDAMPNGGRLTVEVELVLINGLFRATHPWAKPGRYVLVSVSDTGHGIPADQLERIYEPFFTTKGAQAGTGLGLAVANGVVQQHGGMLHCYSEVGIGTTFKVYLPLLSRSARTVGTKIIREARGGTEPILVGEDDPNVRRVAQRILERAGYEVVLVRNGQEVLDTLATRQFSLVLLDVVMPGLPAAETITKIRERHPRVAIVLSSGYTADSNVSTLIKDHGLAFLPKPYDPDALLRALRAELDG